MKIAVRLIVTALILTSIILVSVYYFTMPDPNLSTFNMLADYQLSGDPTNLSQKVLMVENRYEDVDPSASYTTLVNGALDINYNYYKNCLLYVDEVVLIDQKEINEQILNYEAEGIEVLDLAENFIAFYDSSQYASGVSGAFDNFLNAYNVRTLHYYELIVSMKNYVKKYAFNNEMPLSLNNTLLDIILDYSKSVIDNKVITNVLLDSMVVEFESLINKYEAFNNASESSNSLVQNFITAYDNLENKSVFWENTVLWGNIIDITDVNLVSVTMASFIDSIDQQLYAARVCVFLNLGSYNIFE